MTPTEIAASYAELALHSANEAETRLKVIDQVLFSVLGWGHDDVQVERRVSEDGTTTFADYVIRTGMTAFVIEAKRIGVTFDEVPNLRRVRLRGKFMTGQTGEAITQARDYARKLSIPFAVATNGSQWIVFPATRVDGVEFSESSAIVFPSLKSALQEDYAEFYDLLSRKAVIAGSLEADLLGRVENQLEERRLNRFYPNSFSRPNRHGFFPLIEDAINTAFSEDIVNRDADLLEKCYVTTPERMRFDSRIMMHIKKRQPVTARAPLRPMRGDDKALSSLIGAAAGRARPVAILLLGSVGSGKTTFLEYTERVAAKVELSKDAGKPYPHWIKVDFRPYSRAMNPLTFIISALKSYISLEPYLSDYERCVKHAYKEEIDGLMRGPLFLLSTDDAERKRAITKIMVSDYEAGEPYVEKIIRYVARNTAVFLVIDNIDQHEDEGLQSAIFADAMALAHRLNLSLVCSMREGTYVRNRNAPAFDAFDFDPIVVDPPKVDAVLSKRFFVARQLLEGYPGTMIAENGAGVAPVKPDTGLVEIGCG